MPHIFDIETNGLTPTRIWCVVVHDTDSGDTHSFTERGDFAAYVDYNKDAQYVAHNGIGYDFPVLRDLWGIDIGRNQQVDSLVLSRLANPPRSGGHSLRAWGNVLGLGSKGTHDDWSTFSADMLAYCEQDVRITVGLYQKVLAELNGTPQRAIELEHDAARLIHQQELNGWLLDQEKAFMLVAELKEKKVQFEDEVHRRFRPRYTAIRTVTPKVKKNGGFSKVGLGILGDDALSVVAGSFTALAYNDFNLGSRQQIGEYLQRFGWKPTAYTETGQPIVSEKVLMNIRGIPEAELIADYLTVQKRIAMAQSWLDFVKPDGRVHGRVNSNGAVTGRMTHFEPNMAQVTAGSKIYGKEMRECWTVPDGCTLVGMDADGLELRMLAHYMNDDEYIKTVTEGDVHTVNQKAAGLDTRDLAKTFIYAFLYGAGDAKIGSIVGGSKKAGNELKARFLKRTPALKALQDRVKHAAHRGWLKGLDGRKIAVRSQHAALNTLLQGAGAVVMKQAMIRLDQMATAQGLEYKFVGNIHDEIQSEVLTAHADQFGRLAAYAVARAGQDFNLRCPLRGSYSLGKTWKDTH